MKIEEFEAIFAVQLETQNCLMLTCDSDTVKRSVIDELEGLVVSAQHIEGSDIKIDACIVLVAGEIHYDNEDTEFKELKFVVLETY